MRVHIVVTDAAGKVFEGEADLVPAARRAPARQPSDRGQKGRGSGPPSVNFNLPLRAVMNRFTRGLSGDQKFTLLVGALAKGKSGTLVAFKDIRKHWNRMTGPMGGRFNPAYSTRAKDSGWVDTPKTGFYALLPHWREALNGDAKRKRS